MEKINKLINQSIKKLQLSNKTFKDIFEIIYQYDDKIFCEITNGYKIEKLSYLECKENIIKTAIYFEKLLCDYRKGSFVGLLMENSINWIYSFWGLLMAGYKPMLLNLRF